MRFFSFTGIALSLCLLLLGTANGQEYFYDSYQVTNQHRYQQGAVGGFWGHHLGHMVRTATQGLWYMDDTGNDVNINPNINTTNKLNAVRRSILRPESPSASVPQKRRGFSRKSISTISPEAASPLASSSRKMFRSR